MVGKIILIPSISEQLITIFVSSKFHLFNHTREFEKYSPPNRHNHDIQYIFINSTHYQLLS